MINQFSKKSSLFYILLGFTLYESGKNFLHSARLLTFLMVGIGLLLIFYKFLFKKKFHSPFSGSYRNIFYIFLLWSVIIILWPVLLLGESLFDIFITFYNPNHWFAILLPFIVFLGIKKFSLITIYNFSLIYGIIGLFFISINFHQIINPPGEILGESYREYSHAIYAAKNFLFTTSFIILSFPFVIKKHRNVAFFTMIVGLVLVTIAARRSSIFMYLIMFVFTFYLYIFKSGKRNRFKRVLFVLSVVSVGAIIFTMYSDSVFSILLSRFEEDTRSGVYVAFFADFEGKPFDWIFGRGINGAYYHPGISEGVIYRNTIETGYLFLILKGGILFLALFIFILLHAAYRGYYKSNNRLTQGMALYIFAHVLFLVPFGLPSFSLEYVILWVSILYCESYEWRVKTDNEIKYSLLKKKFNF